MLSCITLALVGAAALTSAAPSHPKQAPLSERDLQNGQVDPAPAGYSQWVSPLVQPSPVQDGSGDWGPAIKKAKAFVAKLTLQEKVNLTTGVGTNGPCVGNTGAVTRLGFPGICLQDSPVGVRLSSENSVFPAAINIAATFDPSLMHDVASAMGAEFRGKGINVALAPMTNLARAPAAGRNWEGWGGDPYLAGVATSQAVKGIQSNGVSACVKHFVGNEQEHFRGGSGSITSSSNIDDRTMHEVHDWPFQEGVEAGTTYVMCSYNRLNQTYACQNSKILSGLMKGESDFQGAIVSDWAAITEGVDAALAGTDMNMPGFKSYGDTSDSTNPITNQNSYWGAALIQAVQNGSVPESRLNDMVTRTMSAYYKLGQDSGYPAVNFWTINQGTAEQRKKYDKHVDVQGNHKAIIREVGGASTVLLKNTKTMLPLTPPYKLNRIAVLGSDAQTNSKGPNACSDRGCDTGTLATGWGSGTAEYPYLVSPLSAIQTYAKGLNSKITVDSVLNDFDTSAAAAAAKKADVTLVFVNSDSGEGYITVDGNAGDRNNLSLWHSGDALISAAASASKNVVVIAHSVGAIDMEKWIGNSNVKAVLWAGLPGQESGNAIVDVLWGNINPSGRLPFTIAKKRTDYPADVLYTSSMQVPQITYTEKLAIDYRHFDAANITPRFEFGFGLSYTTFGYSGLSVALTSAAKGGRLPASSSVSARPSLYANVASVTFTVSNTGQDDGYEVPQLYLAFPSSVSEPPKILRGFTRVFIAAEDKTQVTFQIRWKDLATWNAQVQDWVIPTGSFAARVGSSSRNLPLTKVFHIS